MKTVCIVQARMGSTRLPGKVMLPLNGHTVIGEVLTRCKQIPGVDLVVCAISPKPGCEPLHEEAKKYCDTALISVGSEDDVLSRYAAVARTRKADIVVRVTGDCPLISPELCGEVLATLKRENADYASNVNPRTFPKGFDCEAFTNETLQRAHREAGPDQREHVTTWMLKANIRRVNVASPWKLEGRLTLDTWEDYQTIWASFTDRPLLAA